MFDIEEGLDGLKPGEDYNCYCWAMPSPDGEPVMGEDEVERDKENFRAGKGELYRTADIEHNQLRIGENIYNVNDISDEDMIRANIKGDIVIGRPNPNVDHIKEGKAIYESALKGEDVGLDAFYRQDFATKKRIKSEVIRNVISNAGLSSKNKKRVTADLGDVMSLFPMDALIKMTKGGLKITTGRQVKNEIGAYIAKTNTIIYNTKKSDRSNFIHELMHCLDYRMLKDPLKQKNAFEWDVSPAMAEWGQKLRKEYDRKKGEKYYHKGYKEWVYSDLWLEEYEGLDYGDLGGREYLTRRSQYWRDRLSNSGRFQRKQIIDKNAPIVTQFMRIVLGAGAKEEKIL